MARLFLGWQLPPHATPVDPSMMWKKLKAVQMREWGTDQKTLARSRNKTCRSLPSLLAHWIWCYIMLVCSKHPEKPGMPAFCTDVSIKLFCFRYVVILLATMLKKTFPSTFNRLICRNWSMFEASFTLGITTPPALRHAFGMVCFVRIAFICLHSKRKTFGEFSYSRYGYIIIVIWLFHYFKKMRPKLMQRYYGPILRLSMWVEKFNPNGRQVHGPRRTV